MAGYNNIYAVFDLETGGLIKGGVMPPITEIAISCLDYELNDYKEYTTLIKPYQDLSTYEPIALGVSNLTIKDLEENGKEPEVVAKEIKKFFQDLKKDPETKVSYKSPILCGQNSDAFDIPILECFLEKYKVDLSKIVNTDFTIDIMWWARQKYPHLTSYALGNIAVAAGVDLIQAHRALPDTRATKEVVRRMLKDLRGEGGSGSEIKSRFRDNFSYAIKSA